MIGKDEFERQILECQSQMYWLALSIMKNQQDAEDVVSDAIITAFEHRNSLRDPSKFKSWIMTIVANNAKTALRKKKREELTDTFDDLSQSVVSREGSGTEVWDAVMKMKEKYSKVIVLYYYFGFSTKEIGKMLRITQGAVKTRLDRARESLKKDLMV